MSALAPLAMSQTKDELLKHLQMSQETYTLMAKETDRVYKWLTSDKRHLKSNCKRKPPYDWSDVLENSKDEAMRRVAQSGTPHTTYYWSQAVETPECPNWIARWFLYHKFRYRDGRNRNPAKAEEAKHPHRYSSKRHHRSYEEGESSTSQEPYYDESYYVIGSMGSSSTVTAYQFADTVNTGSYTTPSGYSMNEASNSYDHQQQNNGQEINGYYDPVRDATRPN